MAWPHRAALFEATSDHRRDQWRGLGADHHDLRWTFAWKSMHQGRLCVCYRGIVRKPVQWWLARIVGIEGWKGYRQIFRREKDCKQDCRSLHEPDENCPLRRMAKIGETAVVRDTYETHEWSLLGHASVDAHEIDTAGMSALGQSADAREGISAFLEKRAPAFKDKVTQHLPKFFPWWKDRAFKHL